MKTLDIKFKSNNVLLRKVAIVKDDLSVLSDSKKNEADYIFSDPENGFWSITFVCEDDIEYEVQFAYDGYNRTLTPIKAITWVNDIIEDVQSVDSLTIR